MPTIHRLPVHLANQIAAGEVVERPASVVKALIENSLDAQAKRIAIAIDLAGKKVPCVDVRGKKVRGVEDDGDGMDADDARLAIERHGTSKIATPEDLGAILARGLR